MSEHLHPTSEEGKYFLLEDIEKLRRMTVSRRRLMAATEAEELRRLHWMRCPKCGDRLHNFRFDQLKTSRCLHCGGYWLDEAEIQKLARSNGRKITEALLYFFSHP